QGGSQARPAGLVTGADAGAIVAVEVLGEQEAVAPARVLLELRRSAEHRPAPIGVAQEGRGEASGDFTRHLEEGELLPAAGRTLYLEGVAVVPVVLQERAHHQGV